MTRPDAATREAIDWKVLLGSGDASDDDQRRFDTWLAQHPDHPAAWAKVSSALEDTLLPLRARGRQDDASVRALRQALSQVPSRRRFLRGALAVAGVGIGGGLLLSGGRWFDGWGSALTTGTAERKRFALPDGSNVLLNARSRVAPVMTATQRGLRLEQGDMLVEAVAGRLPFLVHSGDAQITSQGGQFMVRQVDERSLVAAIDHSLFAAAPGRAPVELSMGRSAWLDNQGMVPFDHDASSLAAWQRGVLEIDNQSLGQVVDALRPYRHGVIRVAPDAARLRVLGLFPLDDTDRALDLLAATLPITVNRYGPWLAMIEPRDERART